MAGNRVQICVRCFRKSFVYDKLFLRAIISHTSGLKGRQFHNDGKENKENDFKKKKDIVKKPGIIRKSIAKNYLKLISNLEKKYPKLYQVYAVSKKGIESLLADMKVYSGAVYELYNMRKGMVDYSSLNREQLMAYRQVPKDLRKVGFVLLVSTVPFVGNLVFFVAYKYPNHLLSRQFWTAEQQQEFDISKHKHKVDHFPKLLAKLKTLASKLKDERERKKLLDILNKIPESSVSVEELLTVKHLFEHEPLSLWSLNMAHLYHVAYAMDMPKMKAKLIQDAMLLHNIDQVIHKEGIHMLSNAELQQACFDRGVNSYSLTKDEQVQYMKSWLQLSQACTGPSLSLILHGPVFLAWNLPRSTKDPQTT
ncbi:LETM1 domain-containing protein 1 [Lingula anatina]|uniref:LETM1 domain-containing protein 1 n=1 Tax=Lingula anatina TaxID=7574 RepID=A0A1S3HAJ8_LINAN|nr:LETM1 domain-containing protein 1 [Lingula anatina]|eukprot:XP_013383057.1 LETM1 domain-containing protein 1 [Lingula anatina]